MKCEISTNDSPNGLALAFFLNGCGHKCEFCMNKDLWNKNQYYNDFYSKIHFIGDKMMSAAQTGIENFVISGADILHDKENRAYTEAIGYWSNQWCKHLTLHLNIMSVFNNLDFVMDYISDYVPDHIILTMNANQDFKIYKTINEDWQIIDEEFDYHTNIEKVNTFLENFENFLDDQANGTIDKRLVFFDGVREDFYNKLKIDTLNIDYNGKSDLNSKGLSFCLDNDINFINSKSFGLERVNSEVSKL